MRACLRASRPCVSAPPIVTTAAASGGVAIDRMAARRCGAIEVLSLDSAKRCHAGAIRVRHQNAQAASYATLWPGAASKSASTRLSSPPTQRVLLMPVPSKAASTPSTLSRRQATTSNCSTPAAPSTSSLPCTGLNTCMAPSSPSCCKPLCSYLIVSGLRMRTDRKKGIGPCEKPSTIPILQPSRANYRDVALLQNNTADVSLRELRCFPIALPAQAVFPVFSPTQSD